MLSNSIVALGPDDGFRSSGLPAWLEYVPSRRTLFPDGEQLNLIPQAHRLSGRDVLLVVTGSTHQDARLMSALQLLDICRSVGVKSLTLCMPYLPYQRQDRVAGASEPLSSVIVLTALAAAGAQTLLTVDRHSCLPSADGITVHTISGAAIWLDEPPAWALELSDVISADEGGFERASAAASRLNRPVTGLTKWKSDGATHYGQLPQGLRGKSCLLIEDLVSSGSTLLPLRDVLAAHGSTLSVFVTHCLMSRTALRNRLGRDVRVVVTDTSGPISGAIPILPSVVSYWQSLLVAEEVVEFGG